MARDAPGVSGPRRFQTTRWTLVLAARDRASPDAEAALAELCQTYWRPVYGFIRRSGHDVDAAGDLTQAFFTRVLEKNFFARARRERGRLRTFLLTSVRNFLHHERDFARAKKRGSGRVTIPLELEDGERSYRIEPSDATTPEDVYERRWALTVISAALIRVRGTYAKTGRDAVFDRLKPYLTGDDPGSYAELADDLGVSEGSLRVAAHRLRRQFASALRETVAETVESADDVDGELAHLLAAAGQQS